jgi:hypothetical protein
VDAVTADASRFSSQTTTTWEIFADAAVGPGVNVGAGVAVRAGVTRTVGFGVGVSVADGVDDGPAFGLAPTATAEEAGPLGGVVA